MRRGVHLSLVAVLFCIRSSESENEHFICDNTTRYHFDRKIVECRTSVFQQNVILPDNISEDVQFLSIEAKNGSTMCIDRVDMFQNFRSLLGLEIVLSKSVFISERFLDLELKTELQSKLFTPPKMQILIITFSKEFNNKKYNWMLPVSLREFALYNSVMDFDLKPCVHLRKLNLSRTNLSKIPAIEEFPLLTSLDLRFNPLHEFTINDIASFCSLNYLAIQDADLSECECVRLLKYIKLMQKKIENFQFVGSLNCNGTVNGNHSCSTYTLQSALDLRRRCVVTLMRPWAVTLAYFAIITLLLVAFGIGYCVFLLKNFTNVGSYIKD